MGLHRRPLVHRDPRPAPTPIRAGPDAEPSVRVYRRVMEPTAAPHRPDRSAAGAAGWTPASTVVAAVVALALTLAGRMALGDGREPRLAPTMLVIVLTLVPIGVIVVLARGHGTVSAPDFHRPQVAIQAAEARRSHPAS